jgi:hypothetical protein
LTKGTCSIIIDEKASPVLAATFDLIPWEIMLDLLNTLRYYLSLVDGIKKIEDNKISY